jgi:CheY-like chemotaxis protein
MVALAEFPGDSATGFGLPRELSTVRLVGKLSIDLERYNEEAREDRRLASEDRKLALEASKHAIEASRQAREWFSKLDARQDQQLGLIQGDIQRINARLAEGDIEIRAHRAALEAKDDTIRDLVDVVSALRLTVESMRVSPQYEAGPSHLKGLVILVLEDSDLVRTAIARLCTDCGARVLQATTIEEAEAILDAPSPVLDVVAVDLRLNGGDDGMPFVRKLRNFYRVGAIIITGEISEADRAEAASLNVTIVQKPFSIDVLVDAIKAAAGAR